MGSPACVRPDVFVAGKTGSLCTRTKALSTLLAVVQTDLDKRLARKPVPVVLQFTGLGGGDEQLATIVGRPVERL